MQSEGCLSGCVHRRKYKTWSKVLIHGPKLKGAATETDIVLSDPFLSLSLEQLPQPVEMLFKIIKLGWTIQTQL